MSFASKIPESLSMIKKLARKEKYKAKMADFESPTIADIYIFLERLGLDIDVSDSIDDIEYRLYELDKAFKPLDLVSTYNSLIQNPGMVDIKTKENISRKLINVDLVECHTINGKNYYLI